MANVVAVAAAGVELAGITVICAGVVLAAIPAVHARPDGATAAWRAYRQNLGRAILLGLEFLVAADIIRTVTVSPTLAMVTALGLIVVIRTFLSLALELEIQGRFPWQKEPNSASEPLRGAL